MIRTITATLLLLALATAAVHAQYSTDVFTLKKAQDLYDERGFAQGKALSVDGKFIVSESNGNVSYTYPISGYTRNGYPIECSLNYCGSVAFSAFKDYTVAHDGAGDQPPTLYQGWSKFHQNRPAWIIGVNGFAVQMLTTATSFIPLPTSRVHDDTSLTVDDRHVVWVADGYDFCNRMCDFGAVGSSEFTGPSYVDNIRLLRADGSVLELTHVTAVNATPPDRRPEVYTGYYLPMEANSRGFAKVEFDSAYWPAYITSQLSGIANADRRPLIPRVVRYFPGDGMEYVFREWLIPYGLQTYSGIDTSIVGTGQDTVYNIDATTGGKYGGPTIFYLEEINGGTGNLVTFNRTRHYPGPVGFNMGRTPSDDKTRGRAVVTSFDNHTISYGVNSLTVEANGRTTKVIFNKVLPSGTGTSTNWMPIAGNGLMGPQAISIARYPNTEDDLYQSYAGYVTAIIDPEGRRTDFTYETYRRQYRNFGFPHLVSGHTVSMETQNYRLKQVTEPAARYVVDYFKKESDASYGAAGQSAYVTTTGDTIAVQINTDAEHDAAKLSNVAAVVRKYDKWSNLLATDEYRFNYQASSTFADSSHHRRIDAVTGDTVSTAISYFRYTLPNLAPQLPPPLYTTTRRSTMTGAGVTTVNETWYSSSSTAAQLSAWGSQYPISTPMWSTPFVVLDTAQKSWTNGILKSYTSMAYDIDTVRDYGGDTFLAGLFGRDAVEKTITVRNPSTGGVYAKQITRLGYLPLVDTTALTVFMFMRKLDMIRAWDSLRQGGYIDPGLKWEVAMYDPRILLYHLDTAVERVIAPPVAGLPLRSEVRDASNNLLGATASAFQMGKDTLGYLSYGGYGLKRIDTVIGAGGAPSYVSGRYDYRGRIPTDARNANGVLARSSPDYWFPDALNGSGVLVVPDAAVLDNGDSVRAQALHSGNYGNATEEPLATRRYVRRYHPGGALPDTMTLAEYVERGFYGLVTGTRDANGWYSRAAYDADGRLRHAWMPGDFQNADTIYADTVTGRDTADGYGTTRYDVTDAWQDCGQTDPPTPASVTTTETRWGELYADKPAFTAPECPSCSGAQEKHEHAGVLADCHSPINYQQQHPAVGTATFIVLPPDVTRILSLDSAYVRLFVTSVVGQCVTMKVSVPALSVVKTFQLNCDPDSAYNGGGGYGSLAGEKRPRGGILTGDGGGGGYFLTVSLNAVKSSLLTYTPGQDLDVTVEVTTTGGRVELAGGFNGADTRPELVLKGSFIKVNHLADYTLAYAYNDTLLRATVTAKVDDSTHSANKGRWNPLLDIARRTTARHYAGADGRLMASAVDIVEDHGGARTDSARHTYTGLGKRTRTVDPENDTTRTAYDALGRPVTATNADGTTAHMAYRYANPNSLALDDSASYYGFAAVTTSTNENGVKFVTYTDAFDRKRREVADSNGLRLTTRYHYDTLGRLTRVINPKGDTTKYWYDPFGRVMAKSFPDIGVVSYAYDRKGNVRFSQNQEQEYRQLLTFNQYDDLDRLTLTGVAVFNSSYNEDVLNPDIHQARQRKRDRATVLSGGNPAEGRLTDVLDPDRLHSDTVTSILTANRTLWDTPVRSVPAITAAYNVRYCTLPADTLLGDLQTVSDTSIMRATAFYNASGGIAADTNDFEHVGLYPEFARIAVAYDTLPPAAGAVWGAFPSAAQWNALAPRGAVRNQRGREAAVAYRERGSEPFQYVVLSYDERGRVEALLRFTESLGFDAVYYRYNAMNTVVAVTDADVLRQHTTWYGTDANGRIDSVWTALGATGSGLAGAPSGIRYPTPLARPTSPAIVYAYTKTGAVDTMRYPAAGVVVNYDYNHRKWLDSLVATKGTGKLFREILTHDPTGQIIAQIWQHGGGIRMKQNYAYDSTQRLTQWTHGQETGGTTDTTGYAYDNVGNRQSASSTSLGTDTYLYNGGANSLIDRLHDPKFGNDVRATSQYTANGALAWRERHEEIGGTYALFLRQEEMAYSFRGLQMRYQTSAANGTALDDWRYGYSASGERELKRAYGLAGVNTTTGILSRQYYLLGGTNEQLAVYHGQETAGTLCSDTGRRVYMYAAEYLSHAGGTAAVTTLRGGARRYTIADHLGTVRVVVNDAGTIVSKTDYAPFGEPIAVAGVQPRKGYIGKETDVESSTLNTGVRQKDGERFLSVDPKWEKYPGMSPYAYAANSPISFSDPSGAEFDMVGLMLSDPGGTITASLLGDLQNKTGLSLCIDENGRLQYAKDENGAINIGGTYSETARKLLMAEIDNPLVVQVDLNPINSGSHGASNFLYLDAKQIQGFINGASNVNPTTMGWAMTFLHETFHTGLEEHGGIWDPDVRWVPGPVEDVMNVIRTELGGDYGQRLSYISIIDPNTGLSYIPFNQLALNQMKKFMAAFPPPGSYVAAP